MDHAPQVIDCPICGSRMSVPRALARRSHTCHNGHRFLLEAPAPSRPQRAPAVRWSLLGVALVLVMSAAAGYAAVHLLLRRG